MIGDSDGEALLRRVPAYGEESNEDVILRTWGEIKALDHSGYERMSIQPIFADKPETYSLIRFVKIDGRIRADYRGATIWVT